MKCQLDPLTDAVVQLVGHDGNAFSIIASVRKSNA